MMIPHSRRALLRRITELGIAGSLLPSRSIGASEPETLADWQIGCFTRPWGEWDYRTAFDAVAEAGFHSVGLMSTKPKDNAPWALIITADTTVDEARRIGLEAARRDLKVSCAYGGSIPVHESLEAGIGGLRRLIDNCAAAKAQTLLLGGIDKDLLEETYYKAIAESCDYAAEHGVALAIKPHGPLNTTGPACRKRIESVGHRNFRLWYDPGNIYAYSEGRLDPVDDAASVDGLVTGVCVKDYTADSGVRVTPGTGKVDFAGVLARLRQGGLEGGPLIVECLTPGEPQILVTEARKAREFLERLTRAE